MADYQASVVSQRVSRQANGQATSASRERLALRSSGMIQRSSVTRGSTSLDRLLPENRAP